MIFDVISDLITHERQRKQFGFNERIIGLLDKFPIPGRLILYIVTPIADAEHSCLELGGVTIHGDAFTRTPNACIADLASQSPDTIKLSFRSQTVLKWRVAYWACIDAFEASGHFAGGCVSRNISLQNPAGPFLADDQAITRNNLASSDRNHRPSGDLEALPRRIV
jgi:hypothetical protein